MYVGPRTSGRLWGNVLQTAPVHWRVPVLFINVQFGLEMNRSTTIKQENQW